MQHNLALLIAAMNLAAPQMPPRPETKMVYELTEKAKYQKNMTKDPQLRLRKHKLRRN